MNEQDEVLKAKLNSETGQISWQDLQRHFARGVVINVANGADLVEMATCFTNDDKQSVAKAMEQGNVERATDENAKDWEARDPLFWAIVVAPWVLVQEVVEP